MGAYSKLQTVAGAEVDKRTIKPVQENAYRDFRVGGNKTAPFNRRRQRAPQVGQRASPHVLKTIGVRCFGLVK